MASPATPPAPEPLTSRKSWKDLQTHFEKIRGMHLKEFFASDSKRGERMTTEAVGLFLDYSKNRVTDETLQLLLQLAEESGLRSQIDAMFRGDKINFTEKRSVLHVALRAPKGASILSDGVNVVPQVHAVLDKMSDFSNRVRSGEWKGHTGKRIHNVINIGIGGSDLGPVMAYEALRHYSDPAMSFAFRFQRRRHGLRGSRSRPGRGRDVVHHLLENVHDSGNDDERPHGPRLVHGGSGRRRESSGQALRCGVDKRSGSLQVRHRHRQYVWLLGLGWRALLDGFGHRPFDHAGRRPGEFPRNARRLSPDG